MSFGLEPVTVAPSQDGVRLDRAGGDTGGGIRSADRRAQRRAKGAELFDRFPAPATSHVQHVDAHGHELNRKAAILANGPDEVSNIVKSTDIHYRER